MFNYPRVIFNHLFKIFSARLNVSFDDGVRCFCAPCGLIVEMEVIISSGLDKLLFMR